MLFPYYAASNMLGLRYSLQWIWQMSQACALRLSFRAFASRGSQKGVTAQSYRLAHSIID